MNITANAFIFYGYVIPNDIYLPWDSGGDWKDCVIDRLGIKPPQLKLRGNEEKFQEYWQSRNAALRAAGITIEWTGSPKSFKYIIAVKESILWTTREFVQIIQEDDFKVQKNWKQLLDDFCKLLDINITEKPNWFLGTSYEIATKGGDLGDLEIKNE